MFSPCDLEFYQQGELVDCTAVIDQKVLYGTVINYVWDGSIFFNDPFGNRFQLEAGTFYWTFPDFHFHYGPAQKTWHQMWMVINGPRALEYRQQQLLPDHFFHQKVHQRSRFEKKLRDIYEHFSDHRLQRKWRNTNLIDSLLLDLKEERDTDFPPVHSELIHQLAQQLQDQPFLDWNFEHEAKVVHLSLSHFRRLFKQEIGQPPQDFLLRARMHNIAQRLRSSNANISEIASSCGYDNLHYFSKLFKKMMGVSPKHYRQQPM